MPRVIRGFEVGRFTPEQVLRDNGLDVRVGVEQLVDAASKHDNTNPGYLSKDELQKGADDLRASVTGSTTATSASFRYARGALADVKNAYLTSNPNRTFADDEVINAAAQWDDGNGYLKKKELEAGAMELQITSAGRALTAADIAGIRSWTGCDRKQEIGVVSDIDKTVMPPERRGQPPPPPYPGVSALFRLLEFGANGTGAAGDVTYVTARNPARTSGIPGWLAAHNLPAGNIETGTTPQPWIAEDEKVADIERIFLANPGKQFVLFGDSNHRDPEVYRRIREKYPAQVKCVIIHDVKTIDATRVAGHELVKNYADAAAKLLALRVLDEASARTVMTAAQSEGLAITDAEIDALLQAHRP